MPESPSANGSASTGPHPADGEERGSFWQATMPTLPDRHGVPLPSRADVVVIGGGYTGLSAALHLARAGAAVTLLEARTLGWGASTRNGGMAHGGLTWGRPTLHRRYGPELGERLHRAGIEAFEVFERVLHQEALACDYRRSGQLVLAWSRKDDLGFERHAAELESDGLPARVVRDGELHDEIGTDAYAAGLVEEMAGGLHPGRFLAALASRAAEAGVDLHEGLPASGIERMAGRLRVRTPGGPIEAEEVVLATNGYTDRLVPWVAARIIPIGSYIIVTEPLDPAVAASVSPRGRMFFDTKNFLYYWRLTPDGRLLFGGRASFAPTSVDHTARILGRAMRRVHPQVAQARIEYAWGGKVGFTFDRLPHIGRRDGVTYALGYCGSGVCMATYFGTVVAGLLGRGNERSVERSPFELIPHPGAPLPGIYRGDPWFLPIVGEAFRLQDRLRRRR
ncbi:MAG: NAD(P)/FAD-dependent oxidoreductase [Candidatus Limnocylindrales bacterium]